MSVRWQHFPRSQRVPSHLRLVIEAFEQCAPQFADAYGKWSEWALDPARSAAPPRLESNQVLKIVGPALKQSGYTVEAGGSKLPFVVLWGENGRDEKKYFADAKFEHEIGRETVVEVEAGGATANNAWRKDLMEACLMPYVDYLAICVRNEYKSLDRKKNVVRVNQDFKLVTSELDALHESHRLQLPLKGILVIGY